MPIDEKDEFIRLKTLPSTSELPLGQNPGVSSHKHTCLAHSLEHPSFSLGNLYHIKQAHRSRSRGSQKLCSTPMGTGTILKASLRSLHQQLSSDEGIQVTVGTFPCVELHILHWPHKNLPAPLSMSSRRARNTWRALL